MPTHSTWLSNPITIGYLIVSVDPSPAPDCVTLGFPLGSPWVPLGFPLGSPWVPGPVPARPQQLLAHPFQWDLEGFLSWHVHWFSHMSIDSCMGFFPVCSMIPILICSIWVFRKRDWSPIISCCNHSNEVLVWVFYLFILMTYDLTDFKLGGMDD